MSFAKLALFVDLATGKAEAKPLDEQLVKDYLGGVGLGAKLWLDNSKQGADAFGAENPGGTSNISKPAILILSSPSSTIIKRISFPFSA